MTSPSPSHQWAYPIKRRPVVTCSRPLLITIHVQNTAYYATLQQLLSSIWSFLLLLHILPHFFYSEILSSFPNLPLLLCSPSSHFLSVHPLPPSLLFTSLPLPSCSLPYPFPLVHLPLPFLLFTTLFLSFCSPPSPFPCSPSSPYPLFISLPLLCCYPPFPFSPVYLFPCLATFFIS